MTPPTPAPQTPDRGDYTPPRLTAYGRLEVDTAAVGGSGIDFDDMLPYSG